MSKFYGFENFKIFFKCLDFYENVLKKDNQENCEKYVSPQELNGTICMDHTVWSKNAR